VKSVIPTTRERDDFHCKEDQTGLIPAKGLYVRTERRLEAQWVRRLVSQASLETGWLDDRLEVYPKDPKDEECFR
jgi:hypothetical protein